MIDDHPGRAYQTRKRKHHRIHDIGTRKNIPGDQESQPEVEVGKCLRKLRIEQDLSIRNLAQQSGLNANTLSLIENGKSSPSVSTLQQSANPLNVPITAFFKSDMPKNKISYQKAGQRPLVAFHRGTLEDLGGGLTLRGGQPFIVNLEQKAGSGSSPIVHTGHEFVYCP